MTTAALSRWAQRGSWIAYDMEHTNVPYHTTFAHASLFHSPRLTRTWHRAGGNHLIPRLDGPATATLAKTHGGRQPHRGAAKANVLSAGTGRRAIARHSLMRHNSSSTRRRASNGRRDNAYGLRYRAHGWAGAARLSGTPGAAHSSHTPYLSTARQRTTADPSARAPRASSNIFMERASTATSRTFLSPPPVARLGLLFELCPTLMGTLVVASCSSATTYRVAHPRYRDSL